MDTKTKILYVDDEETHLNLFKLLLSKDYDVLTASNVYKGFKLLDENSDISVIFSDLQMLEIDGIEFISIAKEKYPEKKYIIITSLSIITPRVQQALDTKLILKHLSKPINLYEVVNAINSHSL
jgi:response regulator RpfG family c-di-GMP phosphodiesterase